MSTFDSVLAQYEKNKQAAGGNKISNEERMKKYFVTILPKGVRDGEKRVRILPTEDGSTPFKEVLFHEIQVNGDWVKLFDPKQEGKRSPLNEVHDGLIMTGDESDKILARQYKARKFYIVKVIDRENEQDGPKFWRFKHNTKNEGVMDKIFPLFKQRGDITDINTGRDLIITLGLSKSGNGKEYTSITSIIPDDVSPLHTDLKILESWVKDEASWTNVYSKKPEEYLELVAKGEVPKWDNDAKKFVSTTTEETVLISPESSEKSNTIKQEIIVEDPQDDEPDSDDLPF